MKARQRGGGQIILRSALAAAIVMLCLFYVPTPYAVYTPGLVALVAPMVQIDGSERDDEGVFMLTTIRLTYANYWMALQSMWDSDMMLYRKRDVIGDKSEVEYAARLTYVMQQSQSNAVEAAYRAADVPYRIATEQLAVTDIAPGSEDELRPGDRLLALDGQTVRDAETLSAQLGERQAGEQLTWTVGRAGEERQAVSTLRQPVAADGLAPALGLQLAELRKLEPDDPGQTVRIDAGEIGGPSAGLMFALQIYDDLTGGELANGRRIAGTGTIDPEGKVGPIGGISLKITAADAMGAELFLAPLQNAEEAAAKARRIGSNMEVIAVATIDEAIARLQERQG